MNRPTWCLHYFGILLRIARFYRKFPTLFIGPFVLFDQMEDEIGLPPAVTTKKEAPKEEPADSTPVKPVPSGSAKGTPSSSKSSKTKRKLNVDDAKSSNGAPPKKVKTENVCHYHL